MIFVDERRMRNYTFLNKRERSYPSSAQRRSAQLSLGAEGIDVLVTRAVGEVDSYSLSGPPCFSWDHCLDTPASSAMSSTSTMDKAIRRRASVPKDFGTATHELDNLDRSPTSTTHIELDRRTIHTLVMTNTDGRRLAIIRVLRVLHVSNGTSRASSIVLTELI